MWHTFNVYVMLQKYYYWLPEHDRQVMRNFDIQGTKQLKNLFAYARKSRKLPDFISLNNVVHNTPWWSPLRRAAWWRWWERYNEFWAMTLMCRQYWLFPKLFQLIRLSVYLTVNIPMIVLFTSMFTFVCMLMSIVASPPFYPRILLQHGTNHNGLNNKCRKLFKKVSPSVLTKFLKELWWNSITNVTTMAEFCHKIPVKISLTLESLQLNLTILTGFSVTNQNFHHKFLSQIFFDWYLPSQNIVTGRCPSQIFRHNRICD